VDPVARPVEPGVDPLVAEPAQRVLADDVIRQRGRIRTPAPAAVPLAPGLVLLRPGDVPRPDAVQDHRALPEVLRGVDGDPVVLAEVPAGQLPALLVGLAGEPGA